MSPACKSIARYLIFSIQFIISNIEIQIIRIYYIVYAYYLYMSYTFQLNFFYKADDISIIAPSNRYSCTDVYVRPGND